MREMKCYSNHFVPHRTTMNYREIMQCLIICYTIHLHSELCKIDLRLLSNTKVLPSSEAFFQINIAVVKKFSYWRLFSLWFHSILVSNLTFQNAACSLISSEVNRMNLQGCRNRHGLQFTPFNPLTFIQFNPFLYFTIWGYCQTTVTKFSVRKITLQKGKKSISC